MEDSSSGSLRFTLFPALRVVSICTLLSEERSMHADPAEPLLFFSSAFTMLGMHRNNFVPCEEGTGLSYGSCGAMVLVSLKLWS